MGEKLSVNILRAIGLFRGLVLSAAWVLSKHALIHRLAKRPRKQSLNTEMYRLFLCAIKWCVPLQVETRGLEKVLSIRPAIFIANHQSGTDVGIVGLANPDHAVVVGKKEISKIPIFGLFYKWAGNPMIDRSTPEIARRELEEAVNRLKKQGKSLSVFPEGTRNRTPDQGEGLLPFKRGAFQLAIDHQLPLIPIVASSYEGRAQWEDLKLNGGLILVEACDPIYPSDPLYLDVKKLTVEVRHRMVEKLSQLNREVRDRESRQR